MTSTLKDELEKLIEEDHSDLGNHGQALIVFAKATDPSSEINDLNGEWWEKQEDYVRRTMLAGLAWPVMIDWNTMLSKYAGLRQ